VNDTRHLRAPGDPLHTLDAYEQALRNASALHKRAREVVRSFKAQYPDLCTDVLSEMASCDPADNLLPLVIQLKKAIDRR
jgi:hypothetical protein